MTGSFLLITTATFCYFLAVGMLLPTLPRYVEGPLGGGSVAVGIVVGSFAVSAVLLRPFIGGIGDRRGRRILILAGSSVVGLSIAAYALTASVGVMVLLRLFTGVGEAAFYVGAASAINDLAPDERRGEALSYFSLALYSGLAVGPVLGETILGDGNFDATWIVAGISAGLAAIVALRIPETRPERHPDEHHGRPSFVHRAGLLPGTILASQIWGLAGFSAFIPLYALDLGMSGSRAVFASYSVVVLLIRSVGARIPDILGPRRAATVALCTSAVALATMGAWDSPTGLFTGAILFGIGQALTFPALMTLAVSSAPASERGSVVGTFTAFFDLSFGLGAVSLGAVETRFGFDGLFYSAAGVALAGLVILRLFVESPRRARAGEEEALMPEPFQS